MRGDSARLGQIARRASKGRSLAGAAGVRRGKVLVNPWVRDPRRFGSFRPEAVEVVVEVTIQRKPSTSKGCFRQLSELAGHNASERRAGPENAKTRKPTLRPQGEGRCPGLRKNDRKSAWVPPG